MANLNSYKRIIDQGNAAVGKFNDYVKAADEAAAAGKELSEIQQIARQLAVFGEVSSVLSTMSVGLAVVTFLVPQKDIEDQILDEIIALQMRMDDLSNTIESQFDKLHDILTIKFANSQLEAYLIKIQTMSDKLSTIGKLKKKGLPYNELEDDLYATDRNVCHETITAIADICSGDLTHNILQATYHYSYGDLRQVLPLGMRLLNAATMACVVDNAVGVIRLNRDHPKHSIDDELNMRAQKAALVEDNMKIIANAVSTWVKSCLAKVKANVTRRMEAEILRSIKWVDYPTTSKLLVDILSEQWFWHYWAAIVYEGVTGGDNHYYGCKNSNVKRWWRIKAGNHDNTVNIIVRWVRKRDIKRKPAVITIDSLDKKYQADHRNAKPKGTREAYIWNLAQSVSDKEDWFTKDLIKQDLKPVVSKYLKETDKNKSPEDSLVWLVYSNGKLTTWKDMGRSFYRGIIHGITSQLPIFYSNPNWDHGYVGVGIYAP
jgi:hypothetical protein